MEAQTSAERIKQLVEREGKAARNLVTWSVPVASTVGGGNLRSSAVSAGASNHSNSRLTNASRREKRGKSSYRQKESSNKGGLPLAGPAGGQAVGDVGPGHAGTKKPLSTKPPLSEREEVCEYYCSKNQRQSRSLKSPSRLDLHARYWAYLFDNLHRAVDEIYKTCEVDNSIVECQEVIMTLEVCRKDFEALIRRIQLFEQSDRQPKSSNIAWEVRKTTSPGKPRALSHQATPSPPPPSPCLLQPSSKLPPSLNPLTAPGKKPPLKRPKQFQKETNSLSHEPSSISSSTSSSRPSSARSLDFTAAAKLKVYPDSSKKSSGEVKQEGHVASPTWADRVKGVNSVVKPHPPTIEGKNGPLCRASEGGADEDGWETVSRGRIRSAGAASCTGGKPVRTNSHPGKPGELASSPVGQDGGGRSSGGKLPSPTKGRNEETTSTGLPLSGQGQGASVTEDGGKGEGGVSSVQGVEKKEGRGEAAEERRDQCPEQVGRDVTKQQQGIGEGAESADLQGRKVLDEAVGSKAVQNAGSGAEKEKPPTIAPAVEDQGQEGKEDEEADDDNWTWNDALAMYNASEAYRSETSWADRCDSPPGGLSEVPRSPGHAIHLHQRLSSPSRKRPVELEESRRMQEEKQAKAQLQRSKLQEEKTLKSRVEADKIREAKESRDALARQRREALEDKLQRADMLRESHLQERIRRAQEEEAKVSEISFINTLEAQNRKIEVEERYQSSKARLQDLLDERQRKREEQLAKEEAAQERRRTKEAERVAKVMELDQRRKDQEVKVEQMLLERERAREEAAKEKAKERERKLHARNAALLTSTEELGRKIQLKHDESSRRYDQQIEHKKKLATGVISSRHTSAEQPPKVEAYKTKKWCSICHVEIVSEVYLQSHLRGKKHQAAVAAHLPGDDSTPAVEDSVIVDAAEEYQGSSGGLPEIQQRMQAGKKKARKLRQRMSNRVKEIEKKQSGGVKMQSSSNRARFQKALREFNKQVDSAASALSSGGGGGGSPSRLHLASSQLQQVDRALGEISRSLMSTEDQVCFCQLGGVASVMKMLLLSVENCMGSGEGWSLPQKTFSLSLMVLLNCCAPQVENCRYLIASNKAVPLSDLSLLVVSRALGSRHQEPAQAGGGASQGVEDSRNSATLCGPLLRLLASMISMLAGGGQGEGEEDAILVQQTTDAVSYMVSIGLLDKLGEYFVSITGPIEDSALTQLVLGALNLLVATTAFLHYRVMDVFSGKSYEDPTLLTTVLKQTECLGLMQLLYAILLSEGPPRHSHSPPPLSQHMQAIAMATMKALNNSAILDLKMIQACLGAEGISLEFRHIVSYLLWLHMSNLDLSLMKDCVQLATRLRNQTSAISLTRLYCSHYENTGLLHELILAVGYFCVLNHDNQVYLQSGRSPTLLQLLCGLPFEYFSNPKLSQLLYPSLIAACYQMEENKAILEEEISSKLLVTFLQEACKEEERQRRSKKDSGGNGGRGVSDMSSVLQHRFPRAHWEKAITYFSQSSQVAS